MYLLAHVIKCNVCHKLLGVEERGQTFLLCGQKMATRVVLGIHPDTINRTYKRFVPVVQERFDFDDCCSEIFAKIALAIESGTTGRLTSAMLSKGIHDPDLKRGFGHWVTCTEFIERTWGNYLNAQLNKEEFRKFLHNLPEKEFGKFSFEQ